ncbi:thiamine phosphate synthase [Maribacter sp. ACAM166]|uniref:thiamine phosphate synthase n=1 Tax=Maribacter sp. ACAM166 TaxID=2508996 RepID=UPI0010FD6A73|nr:thiamine phosphate synthase [Maribacter sp. ACAM166]TLP77262.1 thiamine phosphate synthase [Maribacter sp. ACAM166]
MIPKLHYISQGKTVEEHLTNINNACTSGIELVQLRLKGYKEAAILEAAEKAREITSRFQTRLILNDYYKIAKVVKADGVHLGQSDTCPSIVRKHLYTWQMVGGTANTLDDCKTLRAKKVDYIGMGPFRFTQTKENLSPVLGLEGYANLLKELNKETPIIAVGGITLDDVSEIMKTGVHGLAVSGEITADFNRIGKFKQLIAGDEVQEKVWTPYQNNN